MLDKVPKAGSVQSAIIERFLLRERFLEGFKVWQGGLFSVFAKYPNMADLVGVLGRQITSVFAIKPRWIPDWYEKVFFENFKNTMDEIERQESIAEAKEKGATAIAHGKLSASDEELLNKMNKLK